MRFTSSFFFLNDTATTEIYTLSLHDALPIFPQQIDAVTLALDGDLENLVMPPPSLLLSGYIQCAATGWAPQRSLKVRGDRKSTRLNSSHSQISYAVFCLKKKKKISKDSCIWI